LADFCGVCLRRLSDPPLSPPPLPAPRRGQGGEPGFGFWLSGQASTERIVATVEWTRAFHACGRSKGLRGNAHPTAAVARPAVHEIGDMRRVFAVCLVASRRGRQPWRADLCRFTTTAGMPVGERRGSGDAPRHRSAAGAKRPNQGPPLYPGGGREGRGGERGATKVTRHRCCQSQAGCSTRTTLRRTEAKSRSYQEGFCTTSAR